MIILFFALLLLKNGHIVKECFYLCFLGVAYSIHIVQIYSFHGGDDIRQHLEVETLITLYFALLLFCI